MSFLTIVLFFLGLILIFLGLRRQSPQDNDLLTALKGLVHLKNELTKVKNDIQVLGDKVDSQDALRRLRDDKHAGLERENTEQTGKEFNPPDNFQEFIKAAYGGPQSWNTEIDRFRFPELKPRDELERELLSGLAESEAEKPARINIPGLNAKQPARILPEKYLKALELANAGMSVKEIANSLALSQDAVNLVLHAYPKGGEV